MSKFIDTGAEGLMVGNPDNQTGSGSAGGSNFVPEGPSPAGGSPPFKGLEPIEEASPKGINIAGPPVNKPGA